MSTITDQVRDHLRRTAEGVTAAAIGERIGAAPLVAGKALDELQGLGHARADSLHRWRITDKGRLNLPPDAVPRPTAIGDVVFRRDMQDQANWLNAQAAKRGLHSADDLPSEDVMSLAEQWRRQHPYVGGVSGTYYRGGSKPADSGFYSRDADYAKGFDKGHFGSYKIDARHALNMDYTYAPEDLDPLFDIMRSEGDVKAADMLQQAVRDDGGVLGSHLYMMMERVGRAAPEYYFGRAGIQAIDTGRDVRALDRAVVKPLQ